MEDPDLEPASLEVDGLFLEARYQRRNAFIDHVGRLTDEFESDYTEGNVVPSEIRLSDEKRRADLIVASDRVWVSRRPPINELDAIDTLQEALEAVEKYVGPLELEYLGARQMLLVPFDDIGDATAAFRRTFFDYRQDPYSAFGEAPIEGQAVVAFRLEDGVSRIRVTAVYRGTPEESAAALLLDVDRNTDSHLDVWTSGAQAMDLLTDARSRALDFVTRLKRDAAGTEDMGGS